MSDANHLIGLAAVLYLIGNRHVSLVVATQVPRQFDGLLGENLIMQIVCREYKSCIACSIQRDAIFLGHRIDVECLDNDFTVFAYCR